ncbi:unnamed protein product [Mytilus edulis]|uniref:Integrator complex subunit 9 n=3 Tax=Mytilus TaxID=6548 RepID=A0A8B6DFD8_MYTGA|nr:unnamed protein product [Mytilus edulis]VDI18188.1 integrator complex subunit 9 [Mytilus galloprovincialis]
MWGNVNIPAFVEALTKNGFVDIKVEDTGEGCTIVDLPNDDTLIQVEPDNTHIICNGEETVRIKIRDALLKCLKKI